MAQETDDTKSSNAFKLYILIRRYQSCKKKVYELTNNDNDDETKKGRKNDEKAFLNMKEISTYTLPTYTKAKYSYSIFFYQI